MEINKRFRTDVKAYTERRNFVIKRPRTDGSHKRKSFSNNSLIFDNGGYTIKVGYTKSAQPTCLPNHIMKAKSERKRCFIANQIEDCRDLSGLFYIMPHDHGYISKFDAQKTVWDYTFNKFPLEDSSVIMTQPILNFRHIQEYMDEIFFEEYDVKSLHRANGTDLSRYQYINTIKKGQDCPCLVIDSGYSFTHIVPYINGKKYTTGIIRLDIGGKLLTNYLKDILSYRQLHVMEETYVINQVKEDTCFMALDFKADMYRAKTTNGIVKNYVLPDFHNIRRGYVQESSSNNDFAENCQILRLNNERITVPEVLMKPSIVPGMEQSGLAQCIAKAISNCPAEYRKALADNIVLTGGNCRFPGFRERVEAEARIYLPSDHRLTVYQADDPINYSWFGGQSLSQDPRFRSYCATKEEYEEYGSNYMYKKFNDFTEIEGAPVKPTEEKRFSYLNHWKDEGVDMFHKLPMTHVPHKDDLEFILEGEGIENLDGKYVTIDFEYESKVPKPVEVITRVPEPIKKPVEMMEIVDNLPKMFKKKKTALLRFDPISNSFMSNTNIRTISAEPGPSIPHLQQAGPSTSNLDKPIPHIIRHPVKVYKPVFKPKLDAKMIDTTKRIITLAGNTVTLSGNSILVPSSMGGKAIINSRHILNNAVLLPQNLLSKNVTLQLIPFKPEMLRQGNITTLITKKPQ